MKMLSQTLRAAVEYLSAFGDEGSTLLFRPIGSEVGISIYGRAWAEYRCPTERPLDERFTVPLRMPLRLVKTLAEDLLIVFRVGNTLKMQVDRNEFVSPLLGLGDLQDAPKVTDGIGFEWEASVFVPELRTAIAATHNGKTGASMESVCIEVLPARETVVASDGRMLTMYEAKANKKNTIRRDDEVDTRILLHRTTATLALATCKSMGLVGLTVGLSHIVVECGRRKSILPLQEGSFPVWRDPVLAMIERPKLGSIQVDTHEFIQAVRQVKPGSEVSGAVTLTGRSHELEIVSKSDDDESTARTAIPIEKRSIAFGPVSVGAKYLLSLAQNWPDGRPLLIEYRGSESPLVFSRPRFRALLMPLVAKEVEGNAKASTRDVAAV